MKKKATIMRSPRRRRDAVSVDSADLTVEIPSASRQAILQTPTSPVSKAIADVERAALHEKWMIAIWRIDGDKIHLDRTALNFPASDVDTAMQLIVQDVQKLKQA